jgi:hypothetical protein
VTIHPPRQLVAFVSTVRALLPHAPAAAARACEVAGLACAGVFLQAVWPPLVWAAAATVLLLVGQRR